MESVDFPTRAAKNLFVPPSSASAAAGAAACPRVYAELLSNIGQVSVFISLPTPSSPQTRVELSADGSSVCIVHDGQATSVPLPARVVPPLPMTLLPPTPATEIPFRLPVDQSTRPAVRIISENAVPWSASSLTDSAAISCRNCRISLVDVGTVSTWKDLPSDNWAEMMDFWHCHKPNEEHDHDCDDNDESYNTNNRLTARPGLGFVDLCYLLLFKEDCHSIKKEAQPPKNILFRSRWLSHRYRYPTSNPPLHLSHQERATDLIKAYPPLSGEWVRLIVVGLSLWEQRPERSRDVFTVWLVEITFLAWDSVEVEHHNLSSGSEKAQHPQVLACTWCSSLLGVVDREAEGWRLHKWGLTITDGTQTHRPVSYRTIYFISAHLLSVIDSQAVRKFLIVAHGSSREHPSTFTIWVFATDLYYTSNSFPYPIRTRRAMKVFYRPSCLEKYVENDVDEVYLPPHVHGELWKELHESNGRLPEQVRKFREWDIGVMERFWDKPEQ